VSSAGYALATSAAACCSASTCCGSRDPLVRHGGRGVAARLSFLSVAVWWRCLDSAVPEGARAALGGGPDRPRGLALLGVGFTQLWGTLRALSTFRNAMLLGSSRS